MSGCLSKLLAMTIIRRIADEAGVITSYPQFNDTVSTQENDYDPQWPYESNDLLGLDEISAME